LMRHALEYATLFGLPVIAHEEDDDLCCGGVMNEGLTALRLGLRGRPAMAEEVMVARDIALAERTGGHLHVAHVSTARAVELVRAARARGVRVSAEVTPHHLFLTEEAVGDYDTNAKMAPPLRTAADVEALRAGLADGTVEAIASDHAPHHQDAKDIEFDQAAFGIVGLETAVGLMLDRLVAAGRLSLPTLVARMSSDPARVLGLPGGRLTPGAPADITILDVTGERTLDPTRFLGRSRNTPFGGWTVTGGPWMTIVGGTPVWSAEGGLLG
jgi:dihydroorotase